MATPEPTYSVLVVDDDFMVARVHTQYLNTVGGFRVIATAYTGAQAITALAEHHPDLLLLDIYLPDMSGIEVLRRTRRDFPEVDVLVITAARELQTVRDAMQGGAFAYLIKPFEYDALGERLTHFRHTRALLSAHAGHIDQRGVDQLFGISSDDRPSKDLPKGLSAETAAAVRALLSHDEPISSTECAQRIGLSRVSARRYLEYLEQAGVATVNLKYGAGRPERLFRLK